MSKEKLSKSYRSDSSAASTVNLPETRWNLPFMQGRKLFVMISVLAIVLSLFSIVKNGFNFGVDFQGGVKLVYQFSNPISEGEIEKLLKDLKLGDPQVVQYGDRSENSILIKMKDIPERDLVSEVESKLKSSLDGSEITLLSEELVGPKVGAELRRRGIFAIVFTWALILAYVGFRFDFLFSPGAIIALIHDVIITTGIFTLLGKEVNLPILAAALTIIGYSINDTIVVFDRIRENLKKLPIELPLVDLINRSLNETLARTIVTSLTLVIAVLILYFFGGAGLQDFTLCMIIGVVVGTYSSIFIASPVYLFIHNLFPHKGISRGEEE